jgi:asparagine synthase (glutamine-hydrolysing)
VRESDFLADAQDLLQHVDEPVADPGLLALYQVVKFSREFVKVVLSGNGGDEFLGGYAPFGALGAYRWAHALTPPALVRLLQQLTARSPASHAYMNPRMKIQRFLRGVPAHPAELLMRWIGSFDHTEARAVLHRDLKPRSLSETSADFNAPLLYEELYREHARVADRDPVTQLVHMFQRFFLPSCICSHSDRASMRLSQELRSPFLDGEMMRLANRLPASMKYRAGRTKVVLRQYLENDLSGAISRRKKQGFTIPIAAWLTSSLKPWADEVLDPQQLEKDGLFDAVEVRRLWSEHQSRQADHGKALWTLLSFQYWLHTHFASWKNR